MQNTNYCLPIIKSTKKEVLSTIEHNKNDYSFLEIWLDYIDDLDTAFIDELMKAYGKKLIFLFRRQNLEKETMGESLRNTLIVRIVASDSLLDFDVKQQKNMLDAAIQKHKINHLITSYHNYTHTPSDENLQDVIDEMSSYNPTIYKISTYCQTPDDALRLLTLLLKLKKEKMRCIMLGMGEHGMITRVFGTLWGNAMVFAPQTKTEASAQGQITKDELKRILDVLT